MVEYPTTPAHLKGDARQTPIKTPQNLDEIQVSVQPQKTTPKGG